jgi:hypothetical protein
MTKNNWGDSTPPLPAILPKLVILSSLREFETAYLFTFAKDIKAGKFS